MKLFVTGGAGYIGSITSRLLLDEGHDVAIYDNLSKGYLSSVDRRARFIEGCLLDYRKTEKAISEFRPDAVLHFASYIEAGESMEDPGKYYRNNVIGAINLASAMDFTNVRSLVFSSSAAVYGNPQRLPIVEDERLLPTNVYGRTKLMAEEIFSSYKDWDFVALRYFNACGSAYGLGEAHNPETHLIPLVLQVALGERDNIKIFGDDYDTPDGTCIRDYVHVSDLAKAHLLALGRDGSYNLGSGRGYSVKEVIDASRKVTGHSIPATVSERRPGDPISLVASYSKAEDELGWRPSHGLDSMIASAWDWMRGR